MRGLLVAQTRAGEVPIDVEALRHVGRTLACEDREVGHMLLSTIERFEVDAVLEEPVDSRR